MDVGLEGGALHTAGDADSLVSVHIGPTRARQSMFNYPGFDGAVAHNFGLAAVTITWFLVIRAKDLATLNLIAANIATAARGGEQPMIDSTWKTRARVTLVEHKPGRGFDTIRSEARSGWKRREDVLTFTDLAP